MARRILLAFVGAALLAACGSDNSVEPSPPVPPVTAPISGLYTLVIQPGPSCATPSPPYQIVVQATQITNGSRTELRATLPGNDPTLALEMLYTSPGMLRGPLGTQTDVEAIGGTFVWFRMIGMGTVSRAADGRGEVVNGPMTGDLSVTPVVGVPVDCVGASNLWSLRAR